MPKKIAWNSGEGISELTSVEPGSYKVYGVASFISVQDGMPIAEMDKMGQLATKMRLFAENDVQIPMSIPIQDLPLLAYAFGADMSRVPSHTAPVTQRLLAFQSLINEAVATPGYVPPVVEVNKNGWVSKFPGAVLPVGTYVLKFGRWATFVNEAPGFTRWSNSANTFKDIVLNPTDFMGASAEEVKKLVDAWNESASSGQAKIHFEVVCGWQGMPVASPFTGCRAIGTLYYPFHLGANMALAPRRMYSKKSIDELTSGPEGFQAEWLSVDGSGGDMKVIIPQSSFAGLLRMVHCFSSFEALTELECADPYNPTPEIAALLSDGEIRYAIVPVEQSAKANMPYAQLPKMRPLPPAQYDVARATWNVLGSKPAIVQAENLPVKAEPEAWRVKLSSLIDDVCMVMKGERAFDDAGNLSPVGAACLGEVLTDEFLKSIGAKSRILSDLNDAQFAAVQAVLQGIIDAGEEPDVDDIFGDAGEISF